MFPSVPVNRLFLIVLYTIRNYIEMFYSRGGGRAAGDSLGPFVREKISRGLTMSRTARINGNFFNNRRSVLRRQSRDINRNIERSVYCEASVLPIRIV